jgi:ribonuclease HII
MDGLQGIDDSKKLSSKSRLRAYQELVSLKSPWAVGFTHPFEIDSLGMTKAFRLASKRAFDALKEFEFILLVDGNLDPKLPVPTLLIPKGDAYSGTIAAASIMAKVTRDTLMEKLDQEYPAYGFAGHKGYPTLDHILRVVKFGPCPEHRISFTPLKGHERKAS